MPVSSPEDFLEPLVDVNELARWMRISVDKAHRLSCCKGRPLIPIIWEAGRKKFRISVLEIFIRRKCFCPTSEINVPYSSAKFRELEGLPSGMPFLWSKEYLAFAGLSKRQLDLRVGRGDFPFFELGYQRLFDPCLIEEARLVRTIYPIVGGKLKQGRIR